MKRILFALAVMLMFAARTIAGQGIYMEYKMTAVGKNSMAGNFKTYSADGNHRTEINMQMPNMPYGDMQMVSLSKKEMPDSIYILNEKNKTYSVSGSGAHKGSKTKPEEDYEIIVLGKEVVNGYKCTRIKLVNKKTSHAMEMWTSKDIKDFADFKGVKNQYMEGEGMYKAMEAKGAEGFPVRIVSTETHGQAMQMDLVKAEKRNVDASMFSLNGYKRVASAMPGGDKSEMMKKMQSMNPEERQKYMEELKKQYKKE